MYCVVAVVVITVAYPVPLVGSFEVQHFKSVFRCHINQNAAPSEIILVLFEEPPAVVASLNAPPCCVPASLRMYAFWFVPFAIPTAKYPVITAKVGYHDMLPVVSSDVNNLTLTPAVVITP